MEFSFDINKNYEVPTITLCNPDRTPIAVLAGISNLHIKPRFNAVSELTFDVFSVYKDPLTSEIKEFLPYKKVSKNRLLLAQGFGYFVIVQTTETNNGTSPVKSVTAYSYEYTLNAKGANISDGNYKFYDPISPTGTLLQKLVGIVPSWSIGKVSADLCTRYRKFEIPTSTLYSFLMDDVEKAYECIFEFDTVARKINAYTVEDVVKDTSICLSFDNLIKNVSIEETSSDIITCLSVWGEKDLTIREVNPLGTSNIYDFSYYLNTDWMPQSLIDAVKKWQNKVKQKETDYAKKFLELKNLTATRNVDGKLTGGLEKIQNDLAELKKELKAKEVVRSAQMPNISSRLVSEISNLEKDIAKTESLLSTQERLIIAKRSELQQINQDLSFSKNFTKSQIEVLDGFIFESNYINSHFAVTRDTPTDRVQEIEQRLFERGKKELARRAQPSFNFSMDAVNFLFLEKFKPFIAQVRLGSLVHAEIRKNDWASPILLEMDIDYDNPENFSMTFGNRYRLQTSEWTFKDLYDQRKMTASFSRNYSSLLEPIKTGALNDEVSEYMQNALNFAKQEIINSDGQEISIGNYGIRGRKKDEKTGEYSNQQLMITNNLICMTNDGWKSCKLAIGTTQGGNYGIIADQVVGKLLAGNSLTIANSDGTFTVDGKKATLTNAKLTVENKNTNKILLDPDVGFKIQKKEGNGWKDKFYADRSGNLILDGKMQSSSGSIGGFTIESDKIKSKNEKIILNSDGSATIGDLEVKRNGTATFGGTIKAEKLEGRIKGGDSGQIARDTITHWNMANDSIRIRHVKANSSAGERLDTIFADKIKVDKLEADFARIGNIYVEKTGTFAGRCLWESEGTKRKSEIRQNGYDLFLSSSRRLDIQATGERIQSFWTAQDAIERNSGVHITSSLFVNQDIFVIGAERVLGDVLIDRNLNVLGSKNNVQNTQHYGKRLINAYETAEYYYADIGESEIKNGVCKIEIEPIFAECVNLNVPYQVFLSPYGRGSIFVSERTPTYFVVAGDDIPFCWELKAKRMGYENTRLEELK